MVHIGRDGGEWLRSEIYRCLPVVLWLLDVSWCIVYVCEHSQQVMVSRLRIAEGKRVIFAW